MQAYEKEQKINFINFQGRLYGSLSMMTGDVPIWVKDRDVKQLTDAELDDLFLVLYEYREVGTKFMHAKQNWERTVTGILDQKAIDDASILYGQTKRQTDVAVEDE